LPHVLQGSVPGAHNEGYGGVFFDQDRDHSSSVPNYAVSAYPGFHYESHESIDSLPWWRDWTFVEWGKRDSAYPSSYNWQKDSLANDVIFKMEGASYTARYKSHMTSFLGGIGLDGSPEVDSGFDGNNQRKLVYLGSDDSVRWYRVIWSSMGRIWTALGSHPRNNQWIKWERETLVTTPWEDTSFSYPAISMHRALATGAKSFGSTFQCFIPAEGSEPEERCVFYAPDLSPGSIIRVHNTTTGASAPKKMAMPAIAAVDLMDGGVDVIAYAANDGIRVVAVSKEHPNSMTSLILFGNASAMYPTLWADTCMSCANNSTGESEAAIYLAWQQKTYDPGRTPGSDTVSDIFAVRFKAGLDGIVPRLSAFTDGTQNPVNVSKQVFPTSYKNQKPCITGVWKGGDSITSYIAYETEERQQQPTFPPTFITVKGISVAHSPMPMYLDGLMHWSRLDLYNSGNDTWTRPSIEATRYQKLGSTLNTKNYYYSLSYEIGNGQHLVHWAKDGAIWRFSGLDTAVILWTNKPQLAVAFDQIDSGQYRVSLSSNSMDHRWLVHQDYRLYKLGLSDTLFGYRRVTEKDTNGLLLTYGFGEVRTDDGEHLRDYEHDPNAFVESFDSTHRPSDVMSSERISLPVNGTVSYYAWAFASNDSLFKANHERVDYAFGFYDTVGTWLFDLDTFAIVDTMSCYSPGIRSVTLSLSEPLLGKLKMRRVSDIAGLSEEQPIWTNMVTMGRLSTPVSNKKIGRDHGSAELASVRVSPNPFSSRTLVTMSLPEESIIDLEIYNSAGQLVDHLIDNGHYRAGNHQIWWDAHELLNGAYLIKLRYNNEIITCRSVLMR
jgi:hypothetical protein